MLKSTPRLNADEIIVFVKNLREENRMDLKKAFLMSNYNICEGKLRLRGRVLKDLKLGDALFLLDYANPVKAQEFIIEKISAYRHELDEICEGMTCELITLENKIDLKEDCIFYVED